MCREMPDNNNAAHSLNKKMVQSVCRDWLYYAVFIIWLVDLSTQQYPVDQPVIMELSENGGDWGNVSCENITFKAFDVIRIPKQFSASQCNCELTRNEAKNQSALMYIYLWLANPRNPDTGLTRKAKVYNMTVGQKYGHFNESLSINIQPLEQTPVNYFDDDLVINKLPIRLFIRGYMLLRCTRNESYDTEQFLIPDINLTEQPLPENSTDWSGGAVNDSEIMNGSLSLNSTDDTNGTYVIDEGRHETIPIFERPSHNNAVIVGIICALVVVIVFAGSMILVSLIMHRKRISRRLEVHLRSIEEANRAKLAEGEPLAQREQQHQQQQSHQHSTDKNVKLLSVQKLNGIIRNKSSTENLNNSQDYMLLSNKDDDDAQSPTQSHNHTANQKENYTCEKPGRKTDKTNNTSEDKISNSNNKKPQYDVNENGSTCNVPCETNGNSKSFQKYKYEKVKDLELNNKKLPEKDTNVRSNKKGSEIKPEQSNLKHLWRSNRSKSANDCLQA